MAKCIIDAMLELEVRDINGALVKKMIQPANSWVKNFLVALRALMYGGVRSNIETITKPDATTTSYPYVYGSASPVLQVTAPAGDDSYGILVGSGTASVTRDDYTLSAKIAHGTATGQLNYGATTLEALASITGGYQFRIVRTFTNDSGANVTVNEIGLFVTFQPTATYEYFMIARDLLATGVTLTPGQTLTVRYIISFTVS